MVEKHAYSTNLAIALQNFLFGRSDVFRLHSTPRTLVELRFKFYNLFIQIFNLGRKTVKARKQNNGQHYFTSSIHSLSSQQHSVSSVLVLKHNMFITKNYKSNQTKNFTKSKNKTHCMLFIYK